MSMSKDMNRQFAGKENSVANKHKNMFNFIQTELCSIT